MLKRMLDRSIRVTIRGTIKLCHDPSDDNFLECAERANADLIITGDKDLLSLGVYKRIRIITPAHTWSSKAVLDWRLSLHHIHPGRRGKHEARIRSRHIRSLVLEQKRIDNPVCLLDAD